MKKDFICATKNYKFLTFNPYFTFHGDNRSFRDHNGKVIERYENFYELFYLGKKAYSLLGIESENDLREMCHGYFVVVVFLLEAGLDQYAKGRLNFLNYESEPITDLTYFKKIKKNPDIHSLIDIAARLFGWGFVIGEEINRQLPPDEIDIFNDVYKASLIHTLIEIDNAICAFDLGSPDALIATQEATKSFEDAQVMQKKIQLEKQQRVAKAKFAATKRHEKTTKAKEKIREIWATGKYNSRDICAEQESAGLDISFSTARKALRNIPDPS